MRLFTGDECGLLKEWIPELARRRENKDAPLKTYGGMAYVTRDGVSRIDPKELQKRSRGVVDMVFTNGDDDDQENVSFATLRQHGSVELWEGSADSRKGFGKYDMKYSTKNLFEDDIESSDKDGKIIRPLGLGSFPKQSRICAGDMFGNLTIVNVASGKIVETFNAYSTSKRGNTIAYTPGKVLNSQLATAMACDPIHGRVAVGGRERETMLLDLSTGKVVFKAKNLPPDPQTLLQQPVWPTAIQFLQDSAVMAVGTGYKEVRLYDVRENSKMRRPTATTPEGLFEHRVTSLCQVDEHELVVGDAAGHIYSLDIRTLGRNPKSHANKNIARYVGPAGSVRQLKKHPTLPRLAAVGLDRMLRIYDTKKRKQLDCVYLKQRLNCVLFGNDDTWGMSKHEEDDAGGDDEDDWDIDQDDVVKDYVDSEDEEKDNNNSEEMSDEQSESEEDQKSSDEEEGESLDDQGDHDNIDVISMDSSSDQESASDSEGKDEVEAAEGEDEVEAKRDDDSDSDEEIVIKAPKRRRR
jgi:ribosome biogenesis protein NSA1